MRSVMLFIAVLLIASPTQAALTSAEIGQVSADPAPGARAPMDLAFLADDGRPTTLRQALAGKPGLLIFADYTCVSLCGPALVLAKVGLLASKLRPGSDYRIAVVGLNPKDGPANALKMRQDHLSDEVGIDRAASFLSGDPANIRSVTTALGYHYIYDPDHDQYAHPAAAYALSSDGKVVRVVSEIGLTGPALRLALVEAGQGRIGNLADRLHVLCYGFDPAAGLYNGAVMTILRIAALLGLLAGAGLLVRLSRRRREASA